ncbi:MAG: hypothetical protein U1D31_02535 [Patescibacteria group bacterium]|nr:hypothetical protein [bacterium]MDZ4240975.1 hypothetical protein [Patescibacteria group bacterium]
MKGIKYFVSVFVALLLISNLTTPVFAGLFYETPTITIVNSTGLDIEVERVSQPVSGELSRSAEAPIRSGRVVTGQSMSFQVPLSKLTLNDSGIRTAAFVVKAYYPGTDQYAGIGPSIMLVRQGHRSVRVTQTYSVNVGIPKGDIKTKKRTYVRSSSPRVYNSPGSAGFHESSRRYGRTRTFTIYVGETREIEPIVLHERDINVLETAQNSN